MTPKISPVFILIYRWVVALGWNPLRTLFAARSFGAYVSSYLHVRRSARGWSVRPSFPQLHDRFERSGVMQGHYFHQDLLVAQLIYAASPVNHLDVGSRTDGLVSHLASFRAVDVLDIRPNVSRVPNIRFIHADITQPPQELHHFYNSVSCLHALEHFGLGRYGDPVDASGHIKGMAGLAKVVKRAGVLYFAVPIGRQRIEFNAHRIFSLATLERLYQPYFELETFNYVDDAGDLHPAVTSLPHKLGDSLSYGCGIFQLRRNDTG